MDVLTVAMVAVAAVAVAMAFVAIKPLKQPNSPLGSSNMLELSHLGHWCLALLAARQQGQDSEDGPAEQGAAEHAHHPRPPLVRQHARYRAEAAGGRDLHSSIFSAQHKHFL